MANPILPMHEWFENPDVSVAVAEPPADVEPPRMYQVLLYNDDFTPMDFVVEILRIFFGKSKAKASEIMWRVHSSGKAVCGIYVHSVAETKVMQVRAYSQNHEYPLRCEMLPI